MSYSGRDDKERDVQERGWFLDWREDDEVEGEIMNAFEYVGLTLMALGIGMFILMGIVYIIAKYIE
ncbi:hypothetical protein EBT31_09975 [bacterium]|jgi:hypothetical protein|nr:hypothetical protein [bacterium]